MAPQNRAAWLKEKQAPSMVVGDAPYHKPEMDEVVVKTKAIAINPADTLIQTLGILLTHYPAILGCDVTGVVEEVGPNITAFKPGDRVIGSGQPIATGVSKYATFQEYVVLQLPQIAKIPDDAAFSDAVVLPLGVNTAASCLFQEHLLALEMPPSQAGTGKTLLVWGASSSVGSCGVQLATAAGYEVFGIASRRNHDMVRSIGATQCFDQSDATLLDDVVAALKGKSVIGAFDAVSSEQTIRVLCEILDRVGGRRVVTGVVPGVESFATHDVTVMTNFTRNSLAGNTVTQHIWRVFLEQALESKAFKYKPTPEIVGHGLETLQKACDTLRAGVSARKIVVTV